jgi:hypothetical protein
MVYVIVSLFFHLQTGWWACERLRVAFDIDDLCPTIHCLVGTKKNEQKSIVSSKVKIESVVKEASQPITNNRRDYRQYNSRPGEQDGLSHFNSFSELTQLYGQIADRAAAKLKLMQQNENKN